METMITVSVLSTLGVVAILASIVVAFIKLKNKVDVNDQKEIISDLHRIIEQVERRIDENNRNTVERFDRLIEQVYETMRDDDNNYHKELDDLRRLIDSRCDKLDSKIKAVSDNLMPKTDKQILND
jgi:glucosamine 6-phosphate synthetase-like amidotransferase/phosphosugar isomerase protein